MIMTTPLIDTGRQLMFWDANSQSLFNREKFYQLVSRHGLSVISKVSSNYHFFQRPYRYKPITCEDKMITFNRFRQIQILILFLTILIPTACFALQQLSHPYVYYENEYNPGKKSELINPEFFGVDSVPWKRLDVLKKTLILYKEMGIGTLGRNGLSWDRFEPTPPRGGKHDYRFEQLDKEFKLYHDYGFQVQAVLISKSPWGTITPSSRLPMAAGSPPKDENLKDWGDFVYELVERYDGDNYKDAFKMKRPVINILSVQGEIEFFSHWRKWGGTFKNYHKLLEITYNNAKRANSQILIARAGISSGTFFDSNPSFDTVMKLSQKNDRVAEIISFMDYSIRNMEFYDLFGIHANRDYTGIEPFINFIRQKMKRNGTTRSILIEDASTVYAGRVADRRRKNRDNETEKIVKAYKVLERGPKHQRYMDAWDYLLQHQIRITIKKAVMSLYTGVESILFTGYVDVMKSPFIQMKYGGFIAQGQSLNKNRKSKVFMKPVYYAMKTFIKTVTEADRVVRRIKLGNNSDIYIFEFLKNEVPFYILWHEESKKVISFPFDYKRATKISLSVAKGTKGPEKEDVPVANKTVRLTLNTDPIILFGSN